MDKYNRVNTGPEDEEELDNTLYVNQDDGFMNSIFRGGLALQGYIATLLCVPFAVCGGGPLVVVKEGEQALVLTYGKLTDVVGPGLYHRNVGTEQYIIQNCRIQTLVIPQQQVMTKDSVAVTLDAVCFYRIIDLKKATFNVSDSASATRNLSQSVLEQLLGEKTLDDILCNRQEMSDRLSELITEKSRAWGIKVKAIEIRDIRVPNSIQRTMAAVAEAEREGMAKVVMAEAELKAAEAFSQAAKIMSRNPVSLQLRYFSTLTEIAADKNSTLVVPSEVSSMFRGLSSYPTEIPSGGPQEQFVQSLLRGGDQKFTKQ